MGGRTDVGQGLTLAPATTVTRADRAPAPHPRTIGWGGASALAMGGSNQSLFLIGAVLAAQGTAAVPLLVVGLLVSLAALPGWIELGAMYPHRVGGIAATCAEAFRPYCEVLANLTGICYWWGWVPTCGLTAILSATAIHDWYLPHVPVTTMAVAIVCLFAAVNLCGVKWAARVAVPMACASGTLALLSAVVPVWAHRVDWHLATSYHLHSPFPGLFGAVTSAMAGLYIVGFAAPAFEAAACHIGEMRNPARDYRRAMKVSAGMACLYFVAIPVVWLGVFGPRPLQGDLAAVLGPTFAPLVGGAGKAFAIWFMTMNMFHGTLQPLSGASRTLSQLADDGLLPRTLGRRNRHDAPWVAILLTAACAMVFLLAGDPIWLIAAANLTYLIGIALPSVAVWLLRRHQPDRPRPYRAGRGLIGLGLAAATTWFVATVLGFEQFGLPTVLFGIGLAYSGSLFYVLRKWRDRVEAGMPRRYRSLYVKLTASMLAVLVLDGAGYLVAVSHVDEGLTALVAALSDIFVAVALLTIAVGLVLPGMISRAARQVAEAADHLAYGTLADLTRAMEALSLGRLDDAHARADLLPVHMHSRDELGYMSERFNLMQREIERAAAALDIAREQLRAHRDRLEYRVRERTEELERSNASLAMSEAHRRNLLEQTVRTIEKQRAQVAGNIHDGPIQRLTALGFAVDRCMLHLHRGQPEGVRILLDDVQHELGGSIADLRRVMGDLRPPILDEGGLSDALRDFVTGIERRSGLRCHLVGDLATPLDDEVATDLYRIAQEAITNVVKHARAAEVVVRLEPTRHGVSLVVEDDGHGIGPAGLACESEALVRQGHFGIALMRERIELLGGCLEISSGARAGTVVRVWLPQATGDPVRPTPIPKLRRELEEVT